MLNQENNLILQSYYTVSFLVELKNNNFMQSKYFKDMKFSSSWIKEGLKEITIDNQGSLLMSLYAMLVIPRQLIGDEFKNEFNQINKFLCENTTETTTSYVSDNNSINYVRHIRNAVAHCKVNFKPNHTVSFSDEGWNKKKQQKEMFTTNLPLDKVHIFMDQLQSIHLKYILKHQN